MAPDYLFRYTNVDSLKYILQDRTIRFSPLTVMDDDLEQYSAYDNEEGKCFFISCWTEKAEEDIRMWKSYCRPDMSCGIRIKLPVNPFSQVDNHLSSIDEIMGVACAIGLRENDKLFERLFGKVADDMDTHLELKKLVQEKYPQEGLAHDMDIRKKTENLIFCMQPDLDKLLFRVIYTDDVNDLFTKIYHRSNGMIGVDFANYGTVKDTSWMWQQEWRYILHFRSLYNGILHRDGTINIYDLPFNHFDLLLKDSAIDQMVITLSPDISQTNRGIVRELVSDSPYRNISIEDSSLLHKGA